MNFPSECVDILKGVGSAAFKLLDTDVMTTLLTV